MGIGIYILPSNLNLSIEKTKGYNKILVSNTDMQRMSIYDSETKIYPDLIPTALQEPQTYQLKKLSKIEAFVLEEIEVCERIAKKKNETI